MIGTGHRRHATYVAAALLVLAACLSAACEKQVVSDDSYSMTRFPRYTNVPDTIWKEQPADNQSNLIEDVGSGVAKGVKKLFQTLGKLNPLKP